MNIWILIILCFTIIWALQIIADTIYGIFYIINEKNRFDIDENINNIKGNNNFDDHNDNKKNDNDNLNHYCF